MDPRLIKKMSRKMRHYEQILLKHDNIKTASFPTNALFIGNGGLTCGISRHILGDTFSCFGGLKDIVLLLDRPYSFIIFDNVDNATKAKLDIQGKQLASGHTFYMSYISESVIPIHPVSKNQEWPKGLLLLENFLTPTEEEELLCAIQFDDSNCDKTNLKHRRVKHYGFEFLYSTNKVDKNMPLEEKIPHICVPHLERLVALGHLPRIPEQLTVNHYLPGQGIPPHIDTHSCFEDSLVSISLGSQVLMDFDKSSEAFELLLPQRSALIMTGDSRYLWRHGITPRKNDCVTVQDLNGSHLTLCSRSPRTSLTFRLLRDGECNCDYKEQCDSQKPTLFLKDLGNHEAKELEKLHVNQVYEEIANHFSNTRYKPWPKVKSFLQNVAVGSFILDIGCGNGKNLKIASNCFEIGCDASSNLVQLCSKKETETLVADCLMLPFRDSCVDVAISIAVIHHMATEERRCQAIHEILRILREGGQSLIYVWAFEQTDPLKGDSNYLKQNHSENFETSEVSIGDSKRITLPVHENRTGFTEQDVLAPWKTNNMVRHRFYHVFRAGELEGLVEKCGGKVVTKYYDEGNWCVVFEK